MKPIWRPLILGIASGLLSGVATLTGLSFLIPGIANNTVGFYMALFLLAAALGGPLAGAIAPALWVITSALFGPPDVKAVVTIPATFWSNVIAVGTVVALVGLAYRFIFERVKMPARLLVWTGIVIACYVIGIPSSLIPQSYLLGDPPSEILPAVLYSYKTYIPQAIFDVLITSLVFVALPARYRRPLWYDAKKAPAQDGRTDR
jgi:hypothetical protein